ncbi:MAG TPA: biotin--[acetyl-CoA-carboxylase] ligase [Marmoricola sp.]|nr:biotin--[acetyl-CoA-carboxylase] ligase [Marmoricola sp.]
MTDTGTSRPPLDRARLATATATAATPWRTVEVVAATPSTNADVAARARLGEAEGLVVVAEHQTAGRGRLDRGWETPARAALTFSVLLRPVGVPDARWPWLPLVAGLAVVDGIADAGGPACGLKWPNDLQHGGFKLAGVLAERVETPDGPAAVLGIGLNVSTRPEELPVPTATSLALAGCPGLDRTALLVSLLAALGRRYDAWNRSAGDPARGVLDDYRRHCVTIGQPVRIHLPSGAILQGVAVEVDAAGALVVESGGRRVTVSAGDVVHVRPGGNPGMP